MNHYQHLIIEATGCTAAEAVEIEEIMRQDIFHSTLDWQSRRTLVRAAQLGYESLKTTRLELAAIGKGHLVP